MADAVFRDLVQEAGLADRFEIDSAGPSSWHAGEKAHPGTREVLANHGIMYRGRSRRLDKHDLNRDWHYIIVMDLNNLHDVKQFIGDHPGIFRLLDFASQSAVRDVPDPYYSGNFEYVYSLVRDGCQGLLEDIRERQGV